MSAAELDNLLRAAVPPAPDRLRARVRALQPQPRRLPVFASRRLLLLAAPAAVAVAAVGAALVHGISSSGPARTSVSATAKAPPAGTLEQAAPLRADTTGSGAAPKVAGGPRLQRYEASLRLRVDGAERLARATTEATRIARSFGGYAASVEYRSPAGRPARAFLELRVPTVRVQDAVARLTGLGAILSQRVSVRDLQRDLERETAQIAQLRRSIELTLTALKDPAVTPVQRIQLQLRLAEARRALAQRTHARDATVSEGTLARISLVLTTGTAAQATAHGESRLDRMVGSAVSFLGLEATIALYALIVTAPLVALVALVWGVGRLRRRRDEKRLLLSS